MNKVIIRSEHGRTFVSLNGVELKDVAEFSMSREIGKPELLPAFRIKMCACNAEIDTFGQVIFEKE